MTRRALRSLAAAGLLPALSALTLTACGGGDKPTVAAPAASAAASAGSGVGSGTGIVITTFQFSAATVAPGATVEVVNNDTDPHTVTSKQSGLFDSGNVSKGTPGSFKAPTTPGTYAFICAIHPGMAGTLTVR